MRKHIDYFYKCYDRLNNSTFEKINSECFNEYGYNFDSNQNRVIDPDEQVKKTNYNLCKSKAESKRK